jgi:hypothetical protein
MGEWIYFLHPPRDNFAETMTDEERDVWGVHFERFQRLRGARRSGGHENHAGRSRCRRRLRAQ